MPTEKDKEKDPNIKALQDAIKDIEKTYGKGAIMRLGEREHVNVDVIPTGSILLDQALGVDVALAVTGNAGPDAEPGKAEVGTVCFALATKDAVWAFPYKFKGERNEIRAAAVDMMVQLALGSFPAAEKK